MSRYISVDDIGSKSWNQDSGSNGSEEPCRG